MNLKNIRSVFNCTLIIVITICNYQTRDDAKKLAGKYGDFNPTLAIQNI